VRVVGKQNSTSGRVRIRVLADQPKDDPCRAIARAFAAADASFAAGQSVTLGTSSDPDIDAASAYRAAAAGYGSIAASLATSGASAQLAMAQHARASVSVENLEQWAEGLIWAHQAAGSYEAAGELYGQARAQAVEATALMELAVSPQEPTTGGLARSAAQDFEQARALLRSAAAFHAKRGESYEQASAENYIGIAFYYEGRNNDATRAYRRALPLYQSLGDQLRQAQVLQNMALAEYELGRFDAAIEGYSQVLQLIKPTEWPVATLIVLNNSALANVSSGNLDAALRQYGRALEMARAAQQPREQAVSLKGIGSVYASLGNSELALDYYDQALAIMSAAIDGRGRSALLRATANVMRQQGRADRALVLDREALLLSSSPATSARIRVQIANDLTALGRPDEALQELESVLEMGANRYGTASGLAWLQRARLRMARGAVGPAEADLRRALETFRVYEAPADEFATWLELARLKRAAGAQQAAFDAVNAALALAEQVRLQSSSPELRASLMQPLRPAFELKIAMLTKEGASSQEISQALMTAEQSRARALADFRNFDDSAPGVSPARAEQRRTLYKELAARRLQLERRLDRADSNDTKAKLLRADIAGLRQQLDQIESEIGAASAAAGRPVSRDDRGQIDVRAIPSDWAVVEYWLGADEAIAWVATREGLEMLRLGPKSRISSAALSFHEAMRAFGTVPEARRLQLGQQLFDLIVRPLTARLAGKRTLVFAPDGVLHYVPFAALRDAQREPARFLIQTYDVAVTDSVDSLLRSRKLRRVAPPPKQMLLVGDPVYGADDSRVQKLSSPSALTLFREGSGSTAESLPRLPGTGREATAIARLVPTGMLDRLEGFDATRERFLQARLSDYRFIHVASHAVSDSEIPQLSALILTTRDRKGVPIEGRVLAADLVRSQLRADLVVLSACDTALGKNIAGEGLVGLRYVVLARGARAVVASLWQVPDRVTEHLMSAFYSSLLRKRSPTVAAMGDAMRALIDGPYDDPALWAAFPIAIGTVQP
jgi:CHAT domain-containing protein